MGNEKKKLCLKHSFFFKNCLTKKIVICYNYDKYNCHNDKKISQKIRGGVEREYRARLGINQQELGKRVGASRQTISLIERGDYSPSVTLALKIAKECNATVEEIFRYEEDEDE